MTLYKTKNLIQSFKHAIDGIVLVFNQERNLKVHCCMAAVVSIAGYLLKISSIEWVVIVLCYTIVFFAEMINTAIEDLIDLYLGNEYSHIAKNIKDVTAGAVLFCAMGVSIVGLIIFLPKILNLFIT